MNRGGVIAGASSQIISSFLRLLLFFARLHSFLCAPPMTAVQTLRAEFRPTLRLAIPLVLAELGWMSMAIVDTMMVGRLPTAPWPSPQSA